MQTTVRQKEQALYEEMWQAPAYSIHSPGERLTQVFLDICGIAPSSTRHTTVLDAGAGTGRGAVALKNIGFRVHMCDLTPDGLTPEARTIPFTPACLWDDLRIVLPYRFGRQYDYVYCTDVMEHIPTQFVMLTVLRLLEVARYGVFFNIALTHENYGAFAGEHSLHKTVESFVWWRDNLATLGSLVECRDLVNSGVYFVRSK